MFIVAITGGIATGKSTVSKIFQQKGIPLVDADRIAREIVEPGKPCWQKIRETFGDEILHPNKEINREALGRIIFRDKEKRIQLNKITHPAIHRTIFIKVFKHFMRGCPYIVLDLPLLFETGILMDFIYKIITVACDSETQLKRLMERNEYSAEDAKKRIESQMSLDKKCEQSHFVINSMGSIEETEAEALRIVQLMNESKHHWRNRLTLLGILLMIVFVVYYLNQIFHFVPNFKSILA